MLPVLNDLISTNPPPEASALSSRSSWETPLSEIGRALPLSVSGDPLPPHSRKDRSDRRDMALLAEQTVSYHQAS